MVTLKGTWIMIKRESRAADIALHLLLLTLFACFLPRMPKIPDHSSGKITGKDIAPGEPKSRTFIKKTEQN